MDCPPDFAKCRQILKSCDQLVPKIINQPVQPLHGERDMFVNFGPRKNHCYLSWSVRLSCLWGLAAKLSSSPSSMWLYPPFETVWEWANHRKRKAIIRALRKYYAGSFKRGLLGSGQWWRSVTVWDRQRQRPLSAPTNCNLHSPLMIFHSYDNGTEASHWLDFSSSKLG